MFSLIPFLERRLESVTIPGLAFAFCALLALSQINRVDLGISPLILGVMLVCCLLTLGFVNLRRWPTVGKPGLLILAAIAVYLVISSAVLLVSDAELQLRDVARQAFFLLVTLAAILGGKALLERIGIEALLWWTFLILTASCAVIAATPFLEYTGVLPEYRLARATGTFADPNDAGFIACMTAVLALGFIWYGRRRWFAYPSLILGYTAMALTVSNSAMIVLGLILVSVLLLNLRHLRRNIGPVGMVVLGLALILFYFSINFQTLYPFQETSPTSDAGVVGETPAPTETSGLTETPAPTEVPLLARQQKAIESIRGETVTSGSGVLGKRVDLWKMGFDKFLESPIVGNGLYQLHSMEGAPMNYERRPAGVHNLYLMLAGEAGIIPLGLYLLALFFLTQVLWTTPPSVGRDILIGWVIAIVLFSGAFQHLLTMGAFNFLIGLSCAIAAFLVQRQREPVEEGEEREGGWSEENPAVSPE